MTRDLFAPKFSLSYLLGTRPGLAAERAADRLLAAAATVPARRPGAVLTRTTGRSVALGLIGLALVGGPGLSLLGGADPTIAAGTLAAPATLHATTPRIGVEHASRAAARTPLQVQTRVVQVDTFRQSGIATWYGPGFHGRTTANGEIFNSGAMTAAHRTLPFGTRLRVCTTKRCVLVRVNDRGPFGAGRVLDLSRAAAQELGTQRSGIAHVTISEVTERTETIRTAPAYGPVGASGTIDAVPVAQSGTTAATVGVGLLALVAVVAGGSFAARRAVPLLAG